MRNLNQTFTALGDETAVSELAKHHNMTLTGVSNHVRVLSEAGLVIVEKRGRTRHCSINPMALKDASDWLDDYRSFWGRQLDNMAEVLKDLDI